MLKNLAAGSLGLIFLATPLLASAATLGDLQAQLQSLLFKLQQLQAASGSTIPQTFTVSPESGTAPLTVVFRERVVTGGGGYGIDFGDGTGIGTMRCDNTSAQEAICNVSHAYTMPGIYRAQLMGSGTGNGPDWAGRGKGLTITVHDPVAGNPFAEIDQHSMISNSSNPTISGTALNTDIEVRIMKGRVAVPSPIDSQSQTYAWRSAKVSPDAGGRWSTQVAGVKLENGFYTVAVSDGKTGYVLATGVLLVDAAR